jgi:signal transduction histidine kinase
MKKNIRWFRNKRFRLMLTLELAVMLPAAALIYLNFNHLTSIRREKNVEATIQRDFQYTLAVSEKKINDRILTMTEEIRDVFPSPDFDSESDKAKKIETLLTTHPWMVHAFLYDEDSGLVLRSQPEQMCDPYVRKESEHMNGSFGKWFEIEGKMMCNMMRMKPRPISCYAEPVKRASGPGFMTTAVFIFPELSKERVVLGGICFDPNYLKRTFFPDALDEILADKMTEDRGDQLAMSVFPNDYDGDHPDKALVSTNGWGEGKPEVSRNMDDVFRGLSLGIKFQGTSAEAIASRWIRTGFVILGALSLLMVGGLVLTYRSVNREMALARLKSDFVSNVSHELRTPLSLIQLYAETLELGRINTEDKKHEYYRIIRKESERLGKLISNILDFSRIEAGRKEYDLRETDIAELVRNTLDTYRYQIEKNGFEFEMKIDSDIPAMRLDREAIARALLNLVNNAIKYSDEQKFLMVKLYKEDGVVKLEVVDRGIGIARRDQTKIFEKFYRTGDPLVHNTKGSGLGLPLVRHITQAHGGDVEVESTPGKGSKFTLSLPLVSETGKSSNGFASGASAS